MFYDLELDEKCEEIFDKFLWVTSERDQTGSGIKTNNIVMGTGILGKGQKSKLKTTVGQDTCSSSTHLNPIMENGEIVDMEEQVPDLVENVENDDSSASGGQQTQPLITFGQAYLNNMGDTTENLGQGMSVTFAVDNENSRDTPPNPHVLLKDVNKNQSAGDKLAALSDKL